MPDIPLGFPPQSAQARFERLTSELRARAETAREEAVTGRMADIATGRRGAVAEVVGIEKRLGDLERYQEAIALAQGRAGVAQTTLSGLVDGAVTLANDTQRALQDSAAVSLATVSSVARDTLGTMIGQLNASFAGRPLFGGDAGGGPAVLPAQAILDGVGQIVADGVAAADDAGTILAAIDRAFFDPGDPDYLDPYRGGAGDAPALEAAPGERIAYHARGDERAILETVRNVATVAAALDPATPVATGRALASLALEGGEPVPGTPLSGLRDVIDPLNRISARIGSAEARIETVRVRNTAEETRLAAVYNDLTGRDRLEAAGRMQAVEGQLETLFLTTSRLSRLNLAAFLR